MSINFFEERIIFTGNVCVNFGKFDIWKQMIDVFFANIDEYFVEIFADQ